MAALFEVGIVGLLPAPGFRRLLRWRPAKKRPIDIGLRMTSCPTSVGILSFLLHRDLQGVTALTT